MTPPIRAVVSARRKKLGLTITAAAAAARMTRANLSDYEAGKSDISTEALGRLMAAMGLRVTATKTRADIS